jgi:hypothetical protein
MMPDTVEQIKPQFMFDGQNLPITDYPEEAQEEPARELAETSEAKEEYGGMDGQSAMYIGDAIASAGPALLSLLGGGSPAVVSSLFDKGDKYARARGAQEEITKANTSVIDVDGQPVNIRSRDVIGKKPYYQTKLGGINGRGGKEFAPVTVKNIRTGEVLPAIVTGQGYKTVDTNELLGPEWLGFKSDQILREKTVQGGSVAKARDQLTGNIKTISSQSGIGNEMGGVSKEEAMAAIDSAKKGKEKSYKQLEAIEGAKRSITILEKPNITPEEAASGIFAIIKANNGERLSDSDYANARGTEFKSYVRQFEDFADGKILGEINPRIIKAYIEVAKSTIQSKQRELQSTRLHFVPDNTLPARGQAKINTIMGGGNMADDSKMDQLKQEILKKLQTK